MECGREYRRRGGEDELLHEVVRAGLTQLRIDAEAHGGLPRHLVQEAKAFLKCGVLQHGFVRVRCGGCGQEALVAFSCKLRGLCPSCGARRAHETAAHLMEEVLATRGEAAAAMAHLRAALAIDLARAAADPSAPGHRQATASDRARIADALVDRNDLPGALAEAEAALAERRAMASEAGANAELQARGNAAAARRAYQAGLDIAEAPVKRRPGDDVARTLVEALTRSVRTLPAPPGR